MERTHPRGPRRYAFAERWSVAPEGSVSTTPSPSPASPDARHQRVRGSFCNRLDRTQALNRDPLSRPFPEEVAGGAGSSARILGGSSMSNRGLRRDRIGRLWGSETLPHARSRVPSPSGFTGKRRFRRLHRARFLPGAPDNWRSPVSGCEWCDGGSPASRPQAEEIPESARLVASVHEFRSRE